MHGFVLGIPNMHGSVMGGRENKRERERDVLSKRGAEHRFQG